MIILFYSETLKPDWHVDKNSTVYVFAFAAIVTLIVSLALTYTSESLRPLKESNELDYKMKDILGGVMEIDKKISKEDVQKAFDENIEQVLIKHDGSLVTGSDVLAIDIDLKKEKKKDLAEQRLPLFVANTDEGKRFIVPVRGNGLWDEIWGFITISNDGSTIESVSFDHASETPGLGAEIKDNKAWKNQFVGKHLFDESGEFVGVKVVKGGVKIPNHQVDAISGATITGDGVADMLENDIVKYVAYLNENKSE